MLQRIVVLLALAFLVSSASEGDAGVRPADLCKDTKGKAAGLHAKHLLKAFGKNSKKTDTAQLGTDVSKAQSKLTKGFSKAESRNGCQTTGDVEAIQADVEAFVADVIAFFSLEYANDANWLCRPGMAENQCFINSLDTTVVNPDTSTILEQHQGSNDHGVDCFYVYPTVDLSGTPGNHTDFSDIGPMLDPLLAHAARFTASCRVFAPLYRQVTLGTFGAAGADEFFDFAYRDVEAAWRHYLEHDNGGRNFIIMGHSQGTGMTTRLIQEHIDPSPELRARLVVALLIGGGVFVPEGEVVGGSFANLPLCTTAEETGCVIAYRTYAEGFPPTNDSNVVSGPGTDTACTNPAALSGGGAMFQKAYFPLNVNQPLFQVGSFPPYGTAFAAYPSFYEGECVKDDNNRSYLEIRIRPAPGDLRENPILFTHPALAPSFLGTHILDYNFPMGDLIELVDTKIAAMP